MPIVAGSPCRTKHTQSSIRTTKRPGSSPRHHSSLSVIHRGPVPRNRCSRPTNAHKDSQAAQAAKVILEGVVLPEFDHELHQSIEFEDADEPAGPARIRHIRVQRVSAFGRLASPGAQVIYILLILAGLGGTLGLAASTQSPHLLLMAGIATPMLLPICVWRWFCWLDASPYYYRLLTTLGEDARNLLDYRLLWKKEGS